MATRGQVKWFDPKKGYGFILGPAGQDVFVHYSQIQGEGFRSLKDGETVDYELIQADKGWQAKNVVRTSPPAAKTAAESAPGIGPGNLLVDPGIPPRAVNGNLRPGPTGDARAE
jgi:cold shock protein